MSLMRAFAKVAIAMAVAKGAEKFTGQGTARASAAGRDGVADTLSGQGGLGAILERISEKSRHPGGLDDAISRAGAAGGLSGVLDTLSKRASTGGGIGGVLGSIAAAAASGVGKGGFADLLDDAINRQGEPKARPSDEQEATAALMLRAMVHASKADGTLDAGERSVLMENLQDATEEERRLVNSELAGPSDAATIAQQTPEGLEPQVYAVSLMAIDPDKPAEAQYLRDLASAMHLGPDDVARIHAELGKAAMPV